MRSIHLSILVLIVVLTVAVAAQAEVVAKKSRGQSIYVPAYSYIYHGWKTQPFLLAVTLSVRNLDRKHHIELDSVAYHDSDGKLVRNLLEKPRTIAPMATAEFVIEEKDKTGGAGASFVLTWKAETPVLAPMVETVMIGTASTQGISFTSPGKVIEELGP